MNRHHIAHVCLAAVYIVITAILVNEHALPHAGCALMAALIYLVLSRPPDGGPPAAPAIGPIFLQTEAAV